MKRILIVGSGDIAMRALPLLTRRYRVYALVRNPDYGADLRKLGAIPLLGDLDDRGSLAKLAGLADAVLHFAPPAAPALTVHAPGGGGRGDARTRNLLAALSRRKPPAKLVYISTSGVYGDCQGEYVSETRPVNAGSDRGRLRVDAEKRIRDWARRNRSSAVILRVPGIYARERLPLARLEQGAPCIVDAEDSHTNHIHADDLAGICVAALERGKSCRVYHASDDSQLKMGEYFDLVADTFWLARPPRLPRHQVQCAVSPMMWSFMNESRRLANRRLRHELKVRLRYPTVADFLAELKCRMRQDGS